MLEQLDQEDRPSRLRVHHRGRPERLHLRYLVHLQLPRRTKRRGGECLIVHNLSDVVQLPRLMQEDNICPFHTEVIRINFMHKSRSCLKNYFRS